MLERLNIKLAIPRQCELNLPGQLRRTGSYYEYAIGGFPMIKPLALLRQCKHVSARITDSLYILDPERWQATLMGISKRRNKYLRKLLIHGARAALPYVAEKDTALGRWAKSLLSRVHQNVAVVAFANKLARICWAVLRSGQKFAAQEAPLVV